MHADADWLKLICQSESGGERSTVGVCFQDCTFFTSKEILRIFSRYQALAPDMVPYDMTGKEVETVRIPHETIATMPELKVSTVQH